MHRACLKGNREAQKEFFDRFSGMARGICLRYANHSEDANDLLQESFIRAFHYLKQYDGKGALGAWIRKICVHVCLENFRKNKTRLAHLAHFQETLQHEQQLNAALQQISMEDLIHKIQQLPNGLRTIFNLYAVEGYNHKEIGDLLQIAEGTSKSQYSRARMLLRQQIENEIKVINHVTT